MKTVFIRAMEREDKAEMLLACVQDAESYRDRARFEVSPESFAKVPKSPFAYWAREEVRGLFSVLPPCEHEPRTVRVGLQTSDDFRFVRLWCEAPSCMIGEAWYGLAKGGAYSPFYADVYLLVNWKNKGAEIRKFSDPESGRTYSRPQNIEYYFRPGLTWPLRTQKGISFRALPACNIFGHKGSAVFVQGDKPESLLALLAVTNSSAFRMLVELQMAFGSYEVGVIQRTPLPNLSDAARHELGSRARRAWSIKRELDTAELSSRSFLLPALLQVQGASLNERANGWLERYANVQQMLTELQREIDEYCFDLYGFPIEARGAAISGVAGSLEDDEETGEEDREPRAMSPRDLVAALVDWVVGVAFGRFDVRIATGARKVPPVTGPFDPLPACPPGMLAETHDLPTTLTPDGYPLELPPGGILVDDPGTEGDLLAEWDVVRRVRSVLAVVFSERATDIEAEICQLLGLRELRDYFRRPTGFFADHLARYSKSRRKAPIYWPLSTASGGYTVWLYYPRLDQDTLYVAVDRHVSPKIGAVEERLAQLTSVRERAEGREASRIASQLSGLSELLQELKGLREEMRQIAALPYRPNLNDGVQISAAPLSRLFRHRPWRSLLGRTWRELSDRKYDWAHLAYAIWPEQVREKCKSDGSLAIAHGLEELYEIENGLPLGTLNPSDDS